MDTTEVLRGETHAATSVRDSAIPVRQVFRREGDYWTVAGLEGAYEYDT